MIELTPAQQAFVDQQIATGAYREPSEVVQAGLDALRREAERREYAETVESVKRGLADHEAGRSMPVEDAYREVRKRLGWSDRPLRP